MRKLEWDRKADEIFLNTIAVRWHSLSIQSANNDFCSNMQLTFGRGYSTETKLRMIIQYLHIRTPEDASNFANRSEFHLSGDTVEQKLKYFRDYIYVISYYKKKGVIFWSLLHSQRWCVRDIWYFLTTLQLVCFRMRYDYHFYHRHRFRKKQQITIFFLLCWNNLTIQRFSCVNTCPLNIFWFRLWKALIATVFHSKSLARTKKREVSFLR